MNVILVLFEHPLLVGQSFVLIKTGALDLHRFPRPFDCRPRTEQLHDIAITIPTCVIDAPAAVGLPVPATLAQIHSTLSLILSLSLKMRELSY